jgi:hypothetical protein
MESYKNGYIVSKLHELKEQINSKEHSNLYLEQVIQTLSIVYDAIDSTKNSLLGVKNADIAVGNIVGSNIFNIFFIL